MNIFDQLLGNITDDDTKINIRKTIYGDILKSFNINSVIQTIEQIINFIKNSLAVIKYDLGG